jgi:hypothetical protein
MDPMGTVVAVMIVVLSAATIVGCRIAISKHKKTEESQQSGGEVRD